MMKIKMKRFLHQSLIFLGVLQSTGEEAWFPNQENPEEVCRNLSPPVCVVLGNNRLIFTTIFKFNVKQAPFSRTAEVLKYVSKADEGGHKTCIRPRLPGSFSTVVNAERSDTKIGTTW